MDASNLETLLIFQCLLTDKEMELRPEEWEETMQDSIKLFLDPEEEEDEEGSDEDEEQGEDNED